MVYSTIFVKNKHRNYPGRARRIPLGLPLGREKNHKITFRIWYRDMVDFKTTPAEAGKSDLKLGSTISFLSYSLLSHQKSTELDIYLYC